MHMQAAMYAAILGVQNVIITIVNGTKSGRIDFLLIIGKYALLWER